jgi:hypothetical protein
MAALVAPAHVEARSTDTTAVEYFAPEGALARAGVSFYGDVRLRWDEVRDRPGVSGDLGLKRLMLRWGLIRTPLGSPLRMEFGLAGTRSDAEIPSTLIGGDVSSPWAPVLNEELNDLAIDRLMGRLSSPGGSFSVAAGRQRSPLRLTEMVWDDDLRPTGIAIIARRDLSPTAAGRLGATLFGRTGLNGNDSGWLGAVQASVLLREEAAAGAEATVSWLRFGRDFEPSRQNQPSPTFGHDAQFEVVDVQLGVRADPAGIPVSLRLDVARNIAHPRDRDGARTRLAIGGSGMPAGAEVGWVFQRVEREALPGAFNSDDWWFHTRMRGHQVWLRAGIGGRFEARVAGFHERRDDVSRPTRRLTAELSARLPSR